MSNLFKTLNDSNRHRCESLLKKDYKSICDLLQFLFEILTTRLDANSQKKNSISSCIFIYIIKA